MTKVFSSKDVVSGSADLCAGGTLAQPFDVIHPSTRRRLHLYAELAVLFVGLPLLMRVAVFDYRIPLFYALPPVLIGFIVFLYYDRTFSLKKEVSGGISRPVALSILGTFAVGSALIGALVAVLMPDRLFALAAERPGLWLKIMTLYPFTSVLAQEFAYRVFFFHRYGPLFHSRWTLIFVNALAFGFAHILFRNWLAVGGTFVIGLLLAWRYERTRSFWPVYAEHVLWGWLAFTIGLGVYFFTGVKNPAW